MITLVDSQSWTASDLTGNSALVVVGTAFFVVGGRREGEGHGIFRSTDHGASWERVGLIPLPAGTTDPAAALSRDGVTLHIVIGRPNATNPLLIDVVRYKFNTSTLVLSAALSLVEGSRVGSAYDILALPGAAGTEAGCLVVTAAQEPSLPASYVGKYVLLAVSVAPDDTLTHAALEQSPWSSGLTCGGLSVVPGDADTLEVFYASHARAFMFRDTEVTIQRRIRSAAGVWGDAEALTAYTGRFTDDKLTVVALPNGGRAVATAYYHWSKVRGQQTSIVYGVAQAQTPGGPLVWRWNTQLADDYTSVKEPVIQSDGTSVRLSYLNCPWLSDTKAYARAGFLRVAVIGADMQLTTQPGAWQGLRFKWLRGTKDQLDAVSKWGVVGIGGNDATESGGGPALYISQYNLPPHAVLQPSTVLAKRGTMALLDASATVDPDLDSLTYTWSHTGDPAFVHLIPIEGGKKATLVVDKAIGPDAVDFTVTVTVDDGQPGHQTSAQALVQVPFNTAPTTQLPANVMSPRNTVCTITATVTDVDADALAFTWTQTAGTPIQLTGIDTPSVTAHVFRVLEAGEVLGLTLEVTDGVNTPVTRSVTVTVPAVSARDRDAGGLSRAYYTVSGQQATIALRNTLSGVWAVAEELNLLSDAFQVRIANLDVGRERVCYTSSKSFLIVAGDTDVRRVYPPTGERILDSAVDENEIAYLLTDRGRVLRYRTEGPESVSDWPDDVIPIQDLVSGRYTALHLEPSIAGRRVLTLYGASGVFLLQVLEDSFEVVDVVRIDMDSGILPSNWVRFVRTNSVIGLKGGQLLVGVVDTSGSTVEVLVDLATRRAIGSWDRSTLLSKTINTGEILQAPADITQGRPSAPDWDDPELVGQGLYTLLWTQRRPDLVVSYEIWLGLDAGVPQLYATVPSGAIRRSTLATQPGHTYHLTLRAQGSSAWSAFSPEQVITT